VCTFYTDLQPLQKVKTEATKKQYFANKIQYLQILCRFCCVSKKSYKQQNVDFFIKAFNALYFSNLQQNKEKK